MCRHSAEPECTADINGVSKPLVTGFGTTPGAWKRNGKTLTFAYSAAICKGVLPAESRWFTSGPLAKIAFKISKFCEKPHAKANAPEPVPVIG